MAVNAYLILDEIEGPSTSRKDAIDCLAFSFGAIQTATYGVGASGKEAKAGRASFHKLSITKVLDKTSPLLFAACVTARVIKSAILAYDKPNGGKQEDYFTLSLKDAIVTSQDFSGASENPTETVSFAFRAVELAYAAEKDDGKLDAFVPKGFDLNTLAPWVLVHSKNFG